MVCYSKNEKDTRKIAGDLAVKIIKSLTLPPLARIRRASVIALEGELGAGKTTFVKGFAGELSVKAKVKSPTFTLMKEYKIPFDNSQEFKESNQRYLTHLDCYRVKDYRDLATLDLKSLFKSPNHIVLIEWPERVRKILPKKLIRVYIDHISKNERKISIHM